jgi:hypothetical protein
MMRLSGKVRTCTSLLSIDLDRCHISRIHISSSDTSDKRI